MRMLTVVGTRPNIIKLALLYKALAKESDSVLVHTGQHYDKNMSDSFFNELELPKPDYNLGVGSDSHAAQTAQIMLALEPVFKRVRPELVMIYGDVNSSLAGALVARKLNIPIAHIEAGVRYNDDTQPEEWNRLIIDKIADLNFCPTRTAKDNLSAEAIVGLYSGDVMLDNFLHYHKKGKRDKDYLLVTLHREANTDHRERLIPIVYALSRIKKHIEFPMHPRTLKMIKLFGIDKAKWFDPHQIIEPVSYKTLLGMLGRASLVITDSGGVQKEAYWSGTPCITLDSHTGWVETLKDGCNTLVTDLTTHRILFEVNCKEHKPFKPDYSLFGNGKAVEKTIEHLKDWESLN